MMRILFITSRYPYPLLKGDQVRAYHQMTHLVKRGHEVILLSFDNGERNVALEQMCKAVYLAKPPAKPLIAKRLLRQVFTSDPLQLAFFYSKAMQQTLEQVLKQQAIDTVLLQLSRMGDYLPPLLEARLPIVLDLIDSLAMNIALKSQKASFPINHLWALESKRLLNYERQMVSRVKAATVVSEKDKAYLGLPAVTVNPNGVELSQVLLQNPKDKETLLFHGNMSYYPNVEAAQLLVRKIMPQVWQHRPACKVLLVGAAPAKEILELASERVEVTGFVKDVKPFLQRATLGVYPILRATGIQNKILEAMMEGLPVLTTTTVAEGISEALAKEHFYIENEPQMIAQKILKLLDDKDELERLSVSGRQLILGRYTWEKQVAALEALMD